MTERVGRDDARDASEGDVALQVALHVAGDNPMELVRSSVDKECLLHILTRRQVIAHRLLSSTREEDDSHLLSLAAHRELVAGEIEVAVERAELGDAQSGGEEEFENSAVAQAGELLVLVGLLRERFFRRFHQTFELGGGNQVYLALGELGELYLLGGDSLDITFPKELKESPERDHIVVLCPTLHRVVFSAGLAIEPQAELADILLGDVAYAFYLHLLEVAGEVVVIILDRLHRATALNLDML